MAFAADDSLSKFLDTCKVIQDDRAGRLGEPAAEECDGYVYLRGFDHLTIAAGLKQASAALAVADAYWLRQHMGGQLPSPVNEALCQRIGALPRQAARAYIAIADLSDDEDEILLDAWHPSRRSGDGQLTEIAAQLADGRVVRAKGR